MDSVKAENICAEALASVVSFISDERAYKKEYNRGWRSSAGPGDTLDNHNCESEAWYDGYFDYSAGRTKLHSMNCENYDVMTGHDHCTTRRARLS